MFEALMLAAAAPDSPAVRPPPMAPPPVQAVMPPVLIANPWPTPRPWQITKSGSFCGAEQAYPTDRANAALLLDIGKGFHLFVVAPGVSVQRKHAATIELRLDGKVYGDIEAVGFQPDTVLKGFAVQIDDAFIDGFAAAKTLRVVRDGLTLMTIDLAGSAATVRQLRKCYAKVRADWAALPPIPMPPVRPPVPRTFPAKVTASNVWVDEDDYPVRAARAGVQGTVRARVDVAANGVATNCTVLQSSGNADLDFRTCVLMEDRFHYLPALDASGKPYPSTYTRAMTWKLEDDAPQPPPE